MDPKEPSDDSSQAETEDHDDDRHVDAGDRQSGKLVPPAPPSLVDRVDRRRERISVRRGDRDDAAGQARRTADVSPGGPPRLVEVSARAGAARARSSPAATPACAP